MSLRSQVNRVLILVGLMVCLPLMAVAEWTRPGGGRAIARGAVRMFGRLCGVRFEVDGTERLDPSGAYVFVANHSSLLDIPAMLSAHPNVRFLAAADLYTNRLLAMAMRALDSVPIDRRDPRTAVRQLRALAGSADQLRLVVFAEGGIPPAGERLPFQTGAFALAIETEAAVVPVAIQGTAEVLPPGGRLVVRPGTVTVNVLEPIPTVGMTIRNRKGIRDQTERAVLATLGHAD